MKLISLKELKESGKRKLFVIPCFFTFANAFFGFFSVIQALEGNFVFAAFLITLAVLMDFLDGRLARVLDSSSSFGMELDSLSDAVSFCFAPAVLLYSWRLSSTGFFGIVILGAYLCAGLLRLAKFNVISQEKGTVDFFVGLPTTSAAFFLIQFVLYQEWIQESFLSFLLHVNSLLALVALLAFLMISPIRFPTFKRVGFSGKLFYIFFAAIVSVASIIFLFIGVPVFFMGLLVYIFCGIFLSFFDFIRFFSKK